MRMGFVSASLRGLKPSDMRYLPRIVDAELAERLAATGAVVVEGPKACGKTATGRHAAASEVGWGR